MKELLQTTLWALIIFAQQNIIGQSDSPSMPFVNAVVKNFVIAAPDAFEFDVFLSNTGTNPFHYATAQYAFNIKSGVIPSEATLTMTMISNDSEIPNDILPINFLTYPDKGILYIIARIPVKRLIFQIAKEPQETKVGRFRVESSMPFLSDNFNITWRNSQSFPETIIIYSDDPSVGNTYEITDDHINFSVFDETDIAFVNFLSLDVILNGQNAQLSWETKNENNILLFEVERKILSAQTWEKLGEVAAYNSRNSSQRYSYFDKKLENGIYLYRLKITAADGIPEYSNAVKVKIE